MCTLTACLSVWVKNDYTCTRYSNMEKMYVDLSPQRLLTFYSCRAEECPGQAKPSPADRAQVCSASFNFDIKSHHHLFVELYSRITALVSLICAI